jgi:hypothetical protein
MGHQDTAGAPTMNKQVQAAGASAASTVNEATAAVGQGGGSFAEAVRRYPVPTVLLGMGLGYLVTPVFASRDRWRVSAGWAGGSILGSTVQQTAQDLSQRVVEAAGGLSKPGPWAPARQAGSRRRRRAWPSRWNP